MQQQQHYPTFTVTPHGITMDGMPLTKSARQNLPVHTLRSIARMEEMLKKVKKEDWDNRTPHATNEVPILAQVKMMAALNSPQPWPPIQKQSWQELAKDAGDDSDDEGDDSGDDSSDNSDDDADGGGYSGEGGSHYNPDEPRIPAGQPGGGQWTTADGDAASDRGSISADDVRNEPSAPVAYLESYEPVAYAPTQAVPAAGDTAQDDINQIKTGIKTEDNGFIAPVKTVTDANGNYIDQVNVFVGGFFDQSYGHIVQTSGALNSAIGSNYYFTYDQQPAITDFINSLPGGTIVNLIGHSYGGDTAARVAIENPDAIDTLITIDPVTTIRSKPDFNAIANSVSNWVDVSANPQDGTETRGDIAAGIFNGHWGSAPDGIADTFIQADQHHEYFDNMMNSRSRTVPKTPLQILNSTYKDSQ